MIKIAIVGAAGRMGRMLIQAINSFENAQLDAAIETEKHPDLELDSGLMVGIGANGVLLSSQRAKAIEDADVVIEFSTPDSTLRSARLCAAHNTALIVGTTGFNDVEEAELCELAKAMTVVKAANYSIGVTVALNVLAMTAKALGDDFDIEVIESHHRHKIDAPSGTALAMGEVLAKATGRDLATHGVFAREGITGARGDKDIGFSTIRGGDIVGEHTVYFAGDGERLEISHKASNRLNFANGAIRAALWATQQQQGQYDMQDVLGLRG